MNLAESRQMTPRQLLEPFWRYLAFSALKDYSNKPKLIQFLAEMMSMNVQELIVYIHGHAMPWLVLTKRRDVIQKIAEVRGEEEPWQPCLDNANLGPILALLLVQEVQDVEDFAMGLLREISPHFDDLTLVDLLQVEPMMTSLELLKIAGDAEETRKPHVSTPAYIPYLHRIYLTVCRSGQPSTRWPNSSLLLLARRSRRSRT